MSESDKPDTTNSLGSKSTYHHGNLRQALIDAAIHLIREDGADSLSMRALAREVGVSQSAPYRHFADKRELVCAIASQGFELLGSGMRKCFEQNVDAPKIALQKAGLYYIHFACEHPEMYRLMFGVATRDYDYANTTSNPKLGYCVLQDIIQRGLELGHFRTFSVESIALAAWSTVHGYSLLLLDGMIEFNDGVQDEISGQLTQIIMLGIQAER